jgi:hypothetical protein
MKIGTSYFRNKYHALRYYVNQSPAITIVDIERMIADGEIHTGKPPLKPGQRLMLIDDNTRYAILED